MAEWLSLFGRQIQGPFRVNRTDVSTNPLDTRGGGLQGLASAVRTLGGAVGSIFGNGNGVQVPAFTTAQRDALVPENLVPGTLIYNTDTDSFDFWSGAAWINLPMLDPAQVIFADGSRAFDADQSMGGNRLVDLADPQGNQDAATKMYVDSVAAGLDPKASCRVATTGPDNLAAWSPTTDGVALNVGDRVVVKNQVDPTENGIYVFQGAGNPMVRAADMDGTPAHEVSGGNFTFVEAGTVNGGTGWVIIHDGVVTIGADPIIWTKFSESVRQTMDETIDFVNIAEGTSAQFALATWPGPTAYLHLVDIDTNVPVTSFNLKLFRSEGDRAGNTNAILRVEGASTVVPIVGGIVPRFVAQTIGYLSADGATPNDVFGQIDIVDSGGAPVTGNVRLYAFDGRGLPVLPIIDVTFP